jgi:hypothetical protein
VRAYCDRRLNLRRLVSDLPILQAVWKQEVGSKPLPWYAEEKLRSGAFSSILGLNVEGGGSWSAFAIGDSCLAQVRGEELCACFPIQRSADFSNRPRLVSSISGASGESLEAAMQLEGKWQEDDRFYLMTDALACWFLDRAEQGYTPWMDLELGSAGHRLRFARWVEMQRGSRTMRNDDVTLLRLELH